MVMKKWSGSQLGKGLGIALSCLAAAGLAAGILWLAAVSFVEPSDLLLDDKEDAFFKSGTFGNRLREHVCQELEFYGESQALDDSGQIDRKAVVDVLHFNDQGKITGTNTSGLAYTLGDLLDWNEKIGTTDGTPQKRILICEDPYGSRHYHYIEDLCEMAEEKNWSLRQETYEETYSGAVLEQEAAETSDDVQEGTDQKSKILDSQKLRQVLEQWAADKEAYYEYQALPVQVIDKNGNTLYSSIALYDGIQLDEICQPQGASSLLEVVNEKQWSLEEIFYALEAVINRIPEKAADLETGWVQHTQPSNVRYLYVDLGQDAAFSNDPAYSTAREWKDSLERFRQTASYAILTSGSAGSAFESTIGGNEGTWEHLVESSLADTALGARDYVFAVTVDTTLPVQDWMATEKDSFYRNVGILKKAIGVCVASMILFLASLAWLTLTAGKTLNFFDRWKTEAAALLVIVVWSCSVAFLQETGLLQPSILSEYLEQGTVAGYQMRFYVAVVAVTAAIMDLFFLWGYLSLVRRIRARTLWRNSILRVLLRQGKRAFLGVFLSLRDIPRKAVVLGAYLSAESFLTLCLADFSYGGGFAVFCLFLIQAAGIGWIVKVEIEYQKIKKGVQKIASGKIAEKIPTQGLTFDRKTLAQDINHIREGLDRAVDESLRSERLKTELITNVSHDIKTPLTSIINYVDLLKREQLPDEKIQGYLDILEKKSQQLKTLTEDVVEASKASTGNLSLEYEDLDLVEMILQVNGEFQEKFSQQGLTLVQHLPEDPVVIRADGRRVWRILENIYQNAYKYAMPHTRIYVELGTEAVRAVFTMKNISQQPLNISPDELTERFIRGDSSRNTQGSGLGLSIAKSLTELQNGEFQLYLDGDLFKVQIAFPLLEGV